MLRGLFGSRPADRVGGSLFAAVLRQARRPEFYEHGGVPDTLDGRFDMIALHLFLVMRHLKGRGEAAEAAARGLVDALFADLDASLRELGVGDLAVGKRIRAMMDGLYGRFDAYDAGLAEAEGGRKLRVALDNNLFGTVHVPPEALERMAAYVRREADALARMPVEALLAGDVRFGPPPAP
ncbi:ubiquinol-cytochrome C chaperone family protein [Arenibaculum sp.]|uniref:ubiquinol-cytochrome C chaperone family protein n=1 Tax=Arenibaculum sp. TaxID=2865862 RepID=UPI002E12782D|nr:ubiquinol-cytochrome C chaperone family protein [Arenibaculum sp.]